MYPISKHKLWDHLAIMSGFELDIDYPYEIIRKDNLVTRPDHIPYSTAVCVTVTTDIRWKY